MADIYDFLFHYFHISHIGKDKEGRIKLLSDLKIINQINFGMRILRGYDRKKQNGFDTFLLLFPHFSCLCDYLPKGKREKCLTC